MLLLTLFWADIFNVGEAKHAARQPFHLVALLLKKL